jgi:thiol-disulfide isomerase/thioredoxin
MNTFTRHSSLRIAAGLSLFLTVACPWFPRCSANGAEGKPVTNNAAGLGPQLKVQVRNPEGKLLPDTPVVFMAEDTVATLRGTSVEGGSLRLKTDAQGSFIVPAETNLFAVVANDQGFVLMQTRDFTNHPFMTVQPWGRVEGVRLNSGKPVVGVRMAYSLNIRYLVSQDQEYYLSDNFAVKDRVATTDQNGRFVFEHVPPVDVGIRESPRHLKETLFCLRSGLEVKPAETSQITIATEGRSITGHFVLGPGLTNFTDLNDRIWLNSEARTRKLTELPTLPAEFDRFEKRAAWWRAWSNTEAARNRAELIYPESAIELHSDGSLFAEIIKPGRYRITGYFYKGDHCIAFIDQAVEVPARKANEQGDEPFDLGGLMVKPILKPGDVAPEFAIKSLTGTPLKLSDYRGKYVILDFWATWCGPCVAEIPHLQSVYRQFGQDDRFVMISLSLDSDAGEALRFVKSKGIPWVQGFLGEWDLDLVTRAYGVDGIPSILLIDPAGKVAASGLRGNKVSEAVAAALKH